MLPRDCGPGVPRPAVLELSAGSLLPGFPAVVGPDVTAPPDLRHSYRGLPPGTRPRLGRQPLRVLRGQPTPVQHPAAGQADDDQRDREPGDGDPSGQASPARDLAVLQRGSVSWPAWLVQTMTVLPAGAPLRTNTSPVRTGPSGAFHRALASDPPTLQANAA